MKIDDEVPFDMSNSCFYIDYIHFNFNDFWTLITLRLPSILSFLLLPAISICSSSSVCLLLLALCPPLCICYFLSLLSLNPPLPVMAAGAHRPLEHHQGLHRGHEGQVSAGGDGRGRPHRLR